MNVVAVRAPMCEEDTRDSLSDVVSLGVVPGTASGSVRSVRESAVSDQSATSTSAVTSLASILAKRAYLPPAEVPTQQGALGIQFDFNDGCRVVLPRPVIPGGYGSAISIPATFCTRPNSKPAG
jgi:hypothetical protein